MTQSKGDNMKRICSVILLAALLCALLCGCGKEALGEADLALEVSGISVNTKTDVQTILNALGDDYDYAEAISCVYTGMDKTYQYDDCILYTYPDGEQDCLMELYCTADVVTAKGITIGAAIRDVESAYGTDYTRAGITVTYALAAPDSLTLPASLYFELENDTVCAIGITTAHRAE